jgi:hypothetical protein
MASKASRLKINIYAFKIAISELDSSEKQRADLVP